MRTRIPAADVSLVAVLTAISMWGLVEPVFRIGLSTGSGTNDRGSSSISLVTVALVLVQTLPLLLRRQHPYAVLAVVAAAFATWAQLAVPPVPATLGVLLALHAAGAADPTTSPGARWAAVLLSDRRRRRRAVTTVIVIVAVVFGIQGLFHLAAAAVVCNVGRAERHYRDDLVRAARDRERVARQERSRIAVELHDIVSHHVGLLGLQAGVARQTFDRRPE
ncbi:MAG: histidine kinase, partial [Phycicoccus sp.]